MLSLLWLLIVFRLSILTLAFDMQMINLIFNSGQWKWIFHEADDRWHTQKRSHNWLETPAETNPEKTLAFETEKKCFGESKVIWLDTKNFSARHKMKGFQSLKLWTKIIAKRLRECDRKMDKTCFRYRNRMRIYNL